eukprot:TRINITY_DN27013_c0_g1_i1.p1 TRINITY_DN27013_c0_g1~~TRINITY_DN27013_c0_g1_i1.p1  ORF type:complete len:418 (-),score=65.67 TRINITY_DN27013_c0_g1_i1:277-1530(-)
MTVKYDPSEGILQSSLRFRNTVANQVLSKPDFYVIFSAHCLLTVFFCFDLVDPHKYKMDLPIGMTEITTSFATFLVLSYNNLVFKRYNDFYNLTQNLLEKTLDIASILNREVQDINIRRRLSRMALASVFLFFFQRIDASRPDGDKSVSSIGEKQLSKLHSLGLLEDTEKDLLLEHGARVGQDWVPTVLIHNWSMKLVRQCIGDHRALDAAYADIRSCQVSVEEMLALPLPFQLFHLMNLLLFLNLLLWGYSVALMRSPMASMIYVCFQMVFQGLLELSISLSDPYGTDAVDFTLHEWMISCWTRVNLITEDAWVEADSFDETAGLPLVLPDNGEQVIDLLTDSNSDGTLKSRARLEPHQQLRNDMESAIKNTHLAWWALQPPKKRYEHVAWGFGGGQAGIVRRHIATAPDQPMWGV